MVKFSNFEISALRNHYVFRHSLAIACCAFVQTPFVLSFFREIINYTIY